MRSLIVGAALLGASAYAGRRRSSGLSGPVRSYLERLANDVGALARTQYPAEEVRYGDDPLFSSSSHKLQCPATKPYLEAGLAHLNEAIVVQEHGVLNGQILLAQAWSAIVQPSGCKKLELPSSLVKLR